LTTLFCLYKTIFNGKELMFSKKEKKKILSELRMVEKQKFYDGLLMSKEQFEELFYYLDENLQAHGCSDTRQFSLQFLADNSIDPTPLITWLEEEGSLSEAEGASCDCDILWIIDQSEKIDAVPAYFSEE
jgi:hypothetical protein